MSDDNELTQISATEFYNLGSAFGGRELRVHILEALDEEGRRKLEADLEAIGQATCLTTALRDRAIMQRADHDGSRKELLAHFEGERAHAQRTAGIVADMRGAWSSESKRFVGAYDLAKKHLADRPIAVYREPLPSDETKTETEAPVTETPTKPLGLRWGDTRQLDATPAKPFASTLDPETKQ